MPSEERLRVDVTSPYISMLFPALELIIITGITWIIIGYMDSDKAAWFLDTNIRNLMVGIWAALSLWRFVLPTIRLRNRRIMVNDERIIIHSANRSRWCFEMLHTADECKKKCWRQWTAPRRAKNRPATFKPVCSINGSGPTNAYNACARAAGRMWAPMPSHP